jgi:methionyl-tRNA formyltransferase
VIETLAGLADGTVRLRQQDHSRATLAPLLDRDDGRIDFAAHTATTIKNRWRGFQPWPGIFTALHGKKLIIHRLEPADLPIAAPPGTYKPGEILAGDNRLFVTCADDTWLELLELQLEGKKRLTAAEFLRGNPLLTGARLG